MDNNVNNFDMYKMPAIDMPPAEEINTFKKNIGSIINLDLSNYKNTQMDRRIVSLMHRNNIHNLSEYLQLLKTNSAKLDEFLNMLTINVSEFFRNPEKFDEFEEKHLPDLVKMFGQRLKIWSAGCSIGAEVYSLAMILDKHNMLDKCQLIASDFDKKILEKAQSGIYTKQEVGTVKQGYEKYFTPIDASKEKYQIDKKIVSSVKFQRQDLLNSTFEKDFDLILCRNVVIYFTEEAKDKLYEKFYSSLKSGGILFIGSTERINIYKQLGFSIKSSFFYQK